MTVVQDKQHTMDNGKVRARLEGVPETLLWTLWNRAVEAGHEDPVLDDPMALRLVDSIDFPFEERFGAPHPLFAQIQGLRSVTFDRAVREYVADHPEATVVALGEGLETGFWRVDNGRLRWLSVDLPEAAELRRRLLPEHERVRVLGCSATDTSTWLDAVEDPAKGVVVTAQGLLMYLRPPEVRDLLAASAGALSGGAFVLDSMARWLTRATRRGNMRIGTMPVPAMRWSMAADERHKLHTAHPGITDVRALTMPRGRGVLGRLIEHQHRVPLFRSISPAVTLVRF
ncbi:class I SAM-dependent methyltransferase [Streptomyces sp. NPDC001941]|uniref:class I SAM-dependent methyltransferase n=1 Tax=Streptomyces sp. NPDC001941 TaxID=3154659 RepID=UPI00331A5B6E